jgi:hypothetical protein
MDPDRVRLSTILLLLEHFIELNPPCRTLIQIRAWSNKVVL